MSDHGIGEQFARRLEQVVGAVVARVEGLTGDAPYREPAADEWSVMQTLGHVSEVLAYWSHQAKRVALSDRDDEPIGRSLDDPDRVGAVERHANARIQEIVPRLRDGLAEATRTLRELPPERWSRTAQHPQRGAISVEYIVEHFLVSHVENHLEQIDRTLAAVD